MKIKINNIDMLIPQVLNRSITLCSFKCKIIFMQQINLYPRNIYLFCLVH